MAIEGQLSSISPYESIRRVRDLMRRENVSTREIILTVSSTDITIKDGMSRVGGVHSIASRRGVAAPTSLHSITFISVRL